MRKAIGLLVALALAGWASAATITEFTLSWVDDPADTPAGIVLDPSLITLGLDDASTDNFDIGIDAEVPPAPPGPWVQLQSYTGDFLACLVEKRPGAENDPGILEVYFLGEVVPTGWPFGQQAGDSWLTWVVTDPNWLELTLTINQSEVYDMLASTEAGVYVGRNSGPFWEISGRYSTVIPEPGTIMLLGSGLAGLAGLARKRY